MDSQIHQRQFKIGMMMKYVDFEVRSIILGCVVEHRSYSSQAIFMQPTNITYSE